MVMNLKKKHCSAACTHTHTHKFDSNSGWVQVDTHNGSIDSVFIVVLLPLVLVPDEELHSSETLLRKIQALLYLTQIILNITTFKQAWFALTL